MGWIKIARRKHIFSPLHVPNLKQCITKDNAINHEEVILTISLPLSLQHINHAPY